MIGHILLTEPIMMLNCFKIFQKGFSNELAYAFYSESCMYILMHVVQFVLV